MPQENPAEPVSADHGAAPIGPLDGHLFGPGQPCFGCGPDHPFGFRLVFERDADTIVTRFTPHDRYQGPPGIMHGGLVSTLADEIAAWAVIALGGKFGFTATFDAKLHRPVRVNVPVIGRGKIVRDRKRLVDVEATIHQDDQLAFASSFTFVVLDKGGAERMLGGPLPPAWERFCR